MLVLLFLSSTYYINATKSLSTPVKMLCTPGCRSSLLFRYHTSQTGFPVICALLISIILFTRILNLISCLFARTHLCNKLCLLKLKLCMVTAARILVFSDLFAYAHLLLYKVIILFITDVQLWLI